MHLRDIKPEDLVNYRELLATVAAESQAFFFSAPPDVESLRAGIVDAIQRRGASFVAEYGGELLGWCEVVPYPQPMLGHAASLSMGVRAAFRGRGIGTALLLTALERARAMELEIVHLEVLATNPRAQSLYRRHGFVIDGIRKRAKRCLVTGRHDDIILMSKFL